MAPLEGLGVARARLETERHCNGGWRVTKGAVSHWIKRGKEEGVKGLRRSIAKGGEPRMSTEQRAQLPVLLSPGAEAFGYRGNVWIGQRLAEVIKRVFGISYHLDHCSRILRQIGWSVQKPIEGPPNAMKRPSHTGKSSIGLFFKKSRN